MYPDLPAAERLERYRSIVPDWEAFLDALSRPLPLCLWVNALRTDRSDVARRLVAEGIETRPLAWHPYALKGPPSEYAGQTLPFVAGLYHIQEEVSMLPVWLLDPRPGELLLDLCAAPGNKTAQAAVAMANTGTVVANDRSAVRMRATRGTLDRLGIMNTAITLGDAECFPLGRSSFDRILVDVPCTCEGTSRKNRSALLTSGREISLGFHNRQLAMLRRAIQLCRPGGRLVYATCTYAPEENELVVDAALREAGTEVHLLPASIDGVRSSPGLTIWEERRLHPEMIKTMRVWPHQNDSGGFFVAVMEKSEKAGGGPSTSNQDEPEGSVSPPSYAIWIDTIAQRFGVPLDVFAGWRLHRPNRKYVFVVPADHRPPLEPELVSDGMPLIRTNLKHPKLTTAGARVIGSQARRNVVDATTEQAER